MTTRIRTTGKKATRIRTTGKKVERLEPAEFAAAIGAQPVTREELANPRSALFLAMMASLERRRQSTGGRPGLEGIDKRVKIPVSNRDWKSLEEIASKIAKPGSTPSPSQIASVVMSMAIEAIAKNAPSLEDLKIHFSTTSCDNAKPGLIDANSTH